MRELGKLEERIKNDGVTALKAGDKRRREALSSFVAALKKARIDAGSGTSTEDQELTVLKREAKRREESAAIYEANARPELAEQERFEAELLATYMPEQLTSDELTALIEAAVTATSAETARDMGKVMGALKAQIAGRADGKVVSDMVRARLGG